VFEGSMNKFIQILLVLHSLRMDPTPSKQPRTCAGY